MRNFNAEEAARLSNSRTPNNYKTLYALYLIFRNTENGCHIISLKLEDLDLASSRELEDMGYKVSFVQDEFWQIRY